MCDPLTIGAGVALAGGTLLQQRQQSQFVSAQNKANRDAYELSRQARQAEIERQGKLSEQQRGEWDRLTQDQTVEAVQQRVDQNAQRRDTATQAAVEDYNVGALPGADTAAQPVAQDIARRLADTAADTKRRLSALAKFGAYGDQGQQQGEQITRSQEVVDLLNSARRGSLGAAKTEADVIPATVTPGNGMAGALLTALGGAGMQYAGFQAGQGAGKVGGGTSKLAAGRIR